MSEVISWEQVDNFIETVEMKYKDKGICGVYGIPRGGLVLAVMTSYRLNIPLLQAPCKHCLVIDDISDSGKTLLHYRESGYQIATMFYVEGSLVKPDVFSYYKRNQWIEYPWEKGEK